MSDDIEAIWAELLLNSQRLLIGCLYRPPDDSSFFDKFDETLGKMQMTRKNLVIVGDLNADVSTANCTVTLNPMEKKLLAILNSHGCKNVISNPTRVTQLTKSTIDLAIVYNPPKVSNSGVLDLSIAKPLWRTGYLSLMMGRCQDSERRLAQRKTLLMMSPEV